MARSCRAVLRALETLAPDEALALTKELLTLRRSLRSISLKLMLPLSHEQGKGPRPEPGPSEYGVGRGLASPPKSPKPRSDERQRSVARRPFDGDDAIVTVNDLKRGTHRDDLWVLGHGQHLEAKALGCAPVVRIHPRHQVAGADTQPMIERRGKRSSLETMHPDPQV